jgi:hypothetical protein
MTVRYSEAQAQSLGLIPAKPVRRSSKTVTADGHVIDPAFMGINEKEFQADVMDLARKGGWTCGAKDEGELGGLTYHAVSVMAQSERGWPDLTLIRRRDRRIIFWELKRENGELSPRQKAVLDLLRCLEGPPLLGSLRPTIQVGCIRPSDMPAIKEALR